MKKAVLHTTLATITLALSGCSELTSRGAVSQAPFTVSTACDAIYSSLTADEFFDVDVEEGKKLSQNGVYQFRETLDLTWSMTPTAYRPAIYRQRTSARLDCRDASRPHLTITAPGLHAVYDNVYEYRSDANTRMAAEWSELVGYSTPAALRAFNTDR